MKCPASDPHFTESEVHGAVAQRRLFKAALYQGTSGRRRAIDAGAHIGTWTVEMARVFGKVEAFEPDADNFECLRENCEALKNVNTRPLALGRSRQRGRVFHPGSNSGQAFIVPGGDIAVVPIDEFKWPDIDFIKIDVEGMEGEVILGAEQTLLRCKPAVFFEDSGLGATHYGDKWEDPKNMLALIGYHRRLRLEKNELWVC